MRIFSTIINTPNQHQCSLKKKKTRTRLTRLQPTKSITRSIKRAVLSSFVRPSLSDPADPQHSAVIIWSRPPRIRRLGSLAASAPAFVESVENLYMGRVQVLPPEKKIRTDEQCLEWVNVHDIQPKQLFFLPKFIHKNG